MYNRMFVAPLLLIMLLCGQSLFLPNQVIAQNCCGLCNCWMEVVYGPDYCYCGGDCASGCFTDDSNSLPSPALTDNRSADATSIRRGFTSPVAQLNVTEPAMDLMSSTKCFRNKVAFRLLGNTRDGLKLKAVRFDGSNAEDQTLAF